MGSHCGIISKLMMERKCRKPERVLTMKKIEGTPGSRYQILNQILSARKLGKKNEAEKELKRFMRQEQYVQNMFTIKKENEK